MITKLVVCVLLFVSVALAILSGYMAMVLPFIKPEVITSSQITNSFINFLIFLTNVGLSLYILKTK